MSDLINVGAREQRLLGDLRDAGAREQRLLGDLRDAGAREQRLHTELSAVLRELRELRDSRNETQERAIRTVRRALVQQSPERISASFPGLSAEQLEAAAAQLDRRGRAGAREDAGARLPAGSAALHPLLLRAAVRLARVGVLNKDDLVDELTLALTALAPEPRDRRTAGALGPARRRAALTRGTVPTRAASGHCACVLIGNGSEPVL
jgi:hypothetical protein